ncbi:MAG: FitA-like ribbon-helix-helix domain-containing protein [Terriglobia bacterium]
MASITIRRLDESLKTKLRVRAAGHGRSMEEEAREILRTGLSAKPAKKLGLGSSIRRHFAPLGGVELEIPKREAVRRPPDFSD